MDYLKRTWCEIDLDALKENLHVIRRIAKRKLIAVVKADAYGHGEKEITRVLAEEEIRFFAVSNINEAINLRHLGIKGKILILGYTPPELAHLLSKYQIIQTVHDAFYAVLLNEHAKTIVNVHIKLDTGMSRLGFPPNEAAADQIAKIADLSHIRVRGIFTHFACSDSFSPEDEAYTQKQIADLNRMVKMLRARKVSMETVHAQNSAGITNYKDADYTFARVGILMYGLSPGDVKGDCPVTPILSWKTIVTMVKKVPAGTYVSYGRTYQTTEPKKIATLAVGYADGYSRALSSKGEVLIAGTRCPVIGRVCMDQMMVDVTHLKDVRMGDTAILIGTDGTETITADQIAALTDTINYEVVCGISKRVPRVYFENGKEVEVIDYSLQ